MTTWEERRAELLELRRRAVEVPSETPFWSSHGLMTAGELVRDLDDAIALGPLLYGLLGRG